MAIRYDQADALSGNLLGTDLLCFSRSPYGPDAPFIKATLTNITNFILTGVVSLPALTEGQSVMGVGSTPTAVRAFSDASSHLSIDWENRYGYYSDGSTIVLNWGNLDLQDTSSNVALTWHLRHLVWTDGITAIMDWQNLLLNDSTGENSIDFGNRYLKNALAVTVANWETQLLIDYAGLSSLAWSDRWAYDSGGTQISYNWGARTLNNSSSTDVLNWGTQKAYTNSGVLSLDWTAQSLYYSATIASLDWSYCVLYDQTGYESIGWNTRALTDSAGTSCLNWATPSLITTPVVFSLTASANQLLFGPTGGHQIALTVPVPSASRTYTLGDAGAPAYFPLDTAESLIITNINSGGQVLTGLGSGQASWQTPSPSALSWSVVSATSYTLSINQNVFVTNSSNQVLTLPSSGYVAGTTIRVMGVGAGGNFQIVSPFTGNIQYGSSVGTTLTSSTIGNNISLVCFSSSGPWYVFPAPLGNFTLV